MSPSGLEASATCLERGAYGQAQAATQGAGEGGGRHIPSVVNVGKPGENIAARYNEGPNLSVRCGKWALVIGCEHANELGTVSNIKGEKELAYIIGSSGYLVAVGARSSPPQWK